MQRYYWVVLSTLFILLFSSCSETIDTLREQRSTNEKLFLSYAHEPGFEKVSLPGLGGDNYVYMKWNKRSNDANAISPSATSSVKVNYSLYILNEYKQSGERAAVVQSNYDKENPAPMSLSGLISGFSIALQNMKVGDEVGVVIPWYLAYGDQTNLSYTSLFYLIKLNSIEAE